MDFQQTPKPGPAVSISVPSLRIVYCSVVTQGLSFHLYCHLSSIVIKKSCSLLVYANVRFTCLTQEVLGPVCGRDPG